MAPITIKVRKNGPYVISGDDVANVIVTDAEGNRLEPGGSGKSISLCRCGASSKKPFCDGTHSKIGFQGAEEAARRFDEQQQAPSVHVQELGSGGPGGSKPGVGG